MFANVDKLLMFLKNAVRKTVYQLHSLFVCQIVLINFLVQKNIFPKNPVYSE